MLIYRQRLTTRLTHWIWAICLFFLLLTGLQIFNAHPALYLGRFGHDPATAIVEIGARQGADGLQGFTRILGTELNTTGVMGAFGDAAQAFPSALTIPSKTSLATGRVIHFFFAWTLVATLVLWLAASALNGHLRELIITPRDLRDLPRDIVEHARLRLHHSARYSPLQKLAYAGVLFLLLPLMIATGLAMSPGFTAAAPWLPELFGGRQTARTIHFVGMLALAGFFAIHMAMILLAGPLNELRSILTGWYRTDTPEGETK